jgi:hypothetical protein
MSDTGRLLVVELVIRPGNEPDPAKFMNLNMLVTLGSREQTADDFGKLYAEAGFRLTNVLHTGSSFDIIEGVPV